jgi:putative MATE family efflux protein
MKLPALFDDRQFYRNLFTVAVPIMLQNLVNAFVNMVDTVMIGRLGSVEIAAVGLGNNVFFLYTMILFGIVSGGSIFTAQFWGRRDIAGIRKNLGFCFLLNLSVAIVFTVIAFWFSEDILRIYSRDPLVIGAGRAYLKNLSGAFIPFAISQVLILTLRSTEEVRLPMITTIIALLINVTLNYFLIFGIGPAPALGVSGAAVATVTARITEAVILITAVYGRKSILAGSFRELTAFNAAYVQRFIRICIPVILNETFWSFGVALQNIIFARTRTDAVAAFNIINTVSQLTWTLFIGLGNGVAVLIGKKIGEGNDARARDYAARIIRFAPLVALGASAVLIPLSFLMPFIFNVNENVLAAAGIMFIILSLSYPFRAFNMSMVIGICRAGGDTVFCGLMDTVFMWFIALPLAACAAYFFNAPAWLIYLCLSSEELCKTIPGLWRFCSGKWLRNVTSGI